MCLNLPLLEKRSLAQGEHYGYEFHVTHSGMGYRCGYVRVLPGHPWFGKRWFDIEAHAPGGVNFGEAGTACATHGPEAEWWVGFDCHHAFDGLDRSLPFLDEYCPPEVQKILVRLDESLKGISHHVWTQEEVLEACRYLAEQAADAANEVFAHG